MHKDDVTRETYPLKKSNTLSILERSLKNLLCAVCGGKLRNKKVTIDRLVKKKLFLFENVRVRVCEQCGETWIPGHEAERMDQAIRGNIKPHKKILVPVY